MGAISVRSPAYLIRNSSSYCFRIIVPIDLRGSIGKREIRYSLRTGELREGVFTKFASHSELAKLLLATGDEELVEDSAGDNFWGNRLGSDRKEHIREDPYGFEKKLLDASTSKIYSEE